MDSIYGLPVFVNDQMGQVRSLPRKRWHRGARCYFDRINKKWRKRFGLQKVIPDGQIIQTPRGVVMNSATLIEVKCTLKDQPHD